MSSPNSKKLRNSFSFPNLLLSCLNLILFILSSSSIAPIILLKTPPTSLGYALLISSSISIFSAFIGIFSRLTHFCFTTYISFLLASLTSQILSFLALFTKEKTTLSMLDSPRDPRESKGLVRVECGVLMAMFLLQFMVLVLSCGIHRCWLREYYGLEEEREKMAARRRSSRIVGVSSDLEMGDVGEVSRVQQGKELDEKVKNDKYSGYHWVKNDFEG